MQQSLKVRQANNYVTKEELYEFGIELANTILTGIQRMFDDQNDKNNQKFKKIDKKFEQIDRRFKHVDKKFGQIDDKFDQLESKMDRRFDYLEAKIDNLRIHTNELEDKIAFFHPAISTQL